MIHPGGAARRQSWPDTGNAPHNRLVSRNDFDALEHLQRSLRQHSIPAASKKTGRLVCVFRHGRIYQSDVGFLVPKLAPGSPPPAGRPRAQAFGTRWEDRAPLIVLMSSDRLFLDRVARQQSPSPLHRQPEHNMHSSGRPAKGDTSTLPARGHFYFALTGMNGRLTRASQWR